MKICRARMLRLTSIMAASCFVFILAPDLLADGTLSGTTHSTLISPCNNEIVTGSVQFLIVVQTNQTATGPHVVALRNFQGTLQDSGGNEYQIQSTSHAEFDALSSSYTFPVTDHVVGVGQGSSLSFSGTGTVTVFVDGNQNPTGYRSHINSLVCGVGN